MDLGLKGKYALITGGSHGIGQSIALVLAEEGCNVAICARNTERLNEVVRRIESTGVIALGIPTNVFCPNDIDNTIHEIINHWGGLHILINNVGGGGSWGYVDIEKNSDKVWREVYEKNAMTAVRFTTLALPWMRRAKWGRVICISSIYGHQAGGEHPWYNMAKAAQISLMKNLSIDRSLVQDGITFNTVAPGFIMIPDTGLHEMSLNELEKFRCEFVQQCPLGRLGFPDEVANVVAFLCSDKASLVNGAMVTVDGGQSRGQ